MKYSMMIFSIIWMLTIAMQASAENCGKSVNKAAKQIVIKLLEQQSSETKAIKLVVG